MTVGDLLGWARDTALRMFPHATAPGLRRIGSPGADSPVFLTGNFTLTVRRLAGVLAGRDAWLLVANSGGINVWCAAGGGHLTHHDVIAVIRTSGIDRLTETRELVLPQLAATGVEPARITEVTGWKTRWGPARLEDLPDYLDRGRRVAPGQRVVRFPLWERLEMALTWALPMAAVVFTVVALLSDLTVGAASAAAIALGVFGIFAVLPAVRITGPAGWLVKLVLSAAMVGAGALLLLMAGRFEASILPWLALASTIAVAVLSLDLAGTTPCYPSTINTFGNRFRVELLPEACTGAAECVLVCPRGVLEMDGPRRKVQILRADDCIRCGACIVQCPDDALRFRYEDGRVVPPSTVRRTRVNMLGRRTIALDDDSRRGV